MPPDERFMTAPIDIPDSFPDPGAVRGSAS